MPTMIVGLDLAKHVFQVHAVDPAGKVTIRKKLRRSEVLEFFKGLPPSLVGIEACGTAHHWGRELTALGHDVRLMPAGYVKPYVKRGKNDAVDAEAICEAVTRPTMRFVEIKSAEQQSGLMLHRTRELLVRQRTAHQLATGSARRVWADRAQGSLEHSRPACACPRRNSRRSTRCGPQLRRADHGPDRRSSDTRTNDREGYSSSAPDQRGQYATANDPWHRRDHGIRNYRHYWRH